MKAYRVVIIRSENDIGIGIERHNDHDIEFIGSYYLQVSEFSRRDTFRFIVDRISAQLNEEELATIRIADPTLKHKHNWYSHYTNIKVVPYPARRFRTANSLAMDALERKTTIEEELI